MTTGDKIRAARKRAGLTQKELGEKLGVTGSLIGIYETDRRNPKNDTLERIASALGVSFFELLSDEDSKRLDSITAEIQEYNKVLERSLSLKNHIDELNKLMGRCVDLNSKPSSKISHSPSDDIISQSFYNLLLLEDTFSDLVKYLNTEFCKKSPSEQAVFIDNIHSILEEFKESMHIIETLMQKIPSRPSSENKENVD